MSGQADRMEALVKYRIEQNRHDRNDVPRLAGARFKPLQLAGAAAAVGRDYQRQRWSVAELLAWHDRQFVQNAYLVLLKRDADVDGLNARLQLLHSGAYRAWSCCSGCATAPRASSTQRWSRGWYAPSPSSGCARCR